MTNPDDSFEPTCDVAVIGAGFSDRSTAIHLFASLGTKEVAVLNRLAYPEDDGPVEKTRAAHAVRESTLTLADAVVQTRRQGYAPLVCGGDGSALLGCGLALARMGRYALVYLDAHHDHHGDSHPGNSDVRHVTGADLAMVTGAGTDLLANIEDRRPYFRAEDVLAFELRHPDAVGRRTPDEARHTGIGLAALEDGRTLGMEWVARAVTDSYEKQEALDGFWVHLDVDVLAPAWMGATDCPEPGGLTPEELTTLLARLLRSPRFAGMDVTLLDPDPDPDDGAQRVLIDSLTRAFQGRVPASA